MGYRCMCHVAWPNLIASYSLYVRVQYIKVQKKDLLGNGIAFNMHD